MKRPTQTMLTVAGLVLAIAALALLVLMFQSPTFGGPPLVLPSAQPGSP